MPSPTDGGQHDGFTQRAQLEVPNGREENQKRGLGVNQVCLAGRLTEDKDGSPSLPPIPQREPTGVRAVRRTALNSSRGCDAFETYSEAPAVRITRVMSAWSNAE